MNNREITQQSLDANEITRLREELRLANAERKTSEQRTTAVDAQVERDGPAIVEIEAREQKMEQKIERAAAVIDRLKDQLRDSEASRFAAEARIAAVKAWFDRDGAKESVCTCHHEYGRCTRCEVDIDKVESILSDSRPPLAVVEGHVVMLKQPRIVGRLPVDFPVSAGDSFPVVVLPKPKEGT